MTPQTPAPLDPPPAADEPLVDEPETFTVPAEPTTKKRHLNDGPTGRARSKRR